MIASVPVIESSLTTPRVRIVSTDQPWEWLGAGWKDLCRTPLASISYGLIFVVLGYWMVYMVEARFQYVLALTTGFLLVGPFLAMGLYDQGFEGESTPDRLYQILLKIYFMK